MTKELAKERAIASRSLTTRAVSLLMVGAALAALALLAIWDPRYYPLFHSVADMGTVFVAGSVFLVVWNGRRHLDNHYYLLVAIAFLGFALLDFMHIIGNKGMGVFPQHGNLGPTFYIAGRYVLGISFLLAPLFIKRRVSTVPLFAVCLLVVVLVVLSVLYWRNFPATYIEGVGLTPFKVYSDYAVCLMLLGGLGLLLLNRRAFDARVLKIIALSLVLSIVTGLAFTLYADPFGLTNAVGHLFQIASFNLVYLGFVETALTSPQNILYRALRDSEQRLQMALQVSHSFAFEWNVATDGVVRSERCAGTLGVVGAEVQHDTGQRYFQRVHSEDRERFVAILAALRPDADSYATQYRLIRGDGSVAVLEEIARGFFDADGKLCRLVGTTTDITERKRAEEELKAAKLSAERAKAAAEEASRAKDQFIAALSHELRTPLTPALVAADSVLKDTRLPDDVREDVEMIHRNVGLEVALIDDLLDVTRIAAGKLVLDKRPVDVAQVLRDAARISAVDLDGRSQTLKIEMPSEPLVVEGDAVRLHQVFWNLVKNAIKFTPHGGRIAIHVSVTSKMLHIKVRDTGIGISAEVLPRLFSRFEQGAASTTRQFGGLGLGLAICRAIVELHGGRISARSDGKDKGSTFEVELPLAPHLAMRLASAPPLQQVPSVRLVPPRPLKILLVEDHPDTAKLMRRLLRAEGHEVTTAASVSDGLGAVRQQEPDVLISDLGLPDGSGLDLMRQLLAAGKRIPSIALSGYGAPADIEASIAAGFSEHLVKPLSTVTALTAALARLRAGGESPKLAATGGDTNG